jgi:hypothetical protein
MRPIILPDIILLFGEGKCFNGIQRTPIQELGLLATHSIDDSPDDNVD